MKNIKAILIAFVLLSMNSVVFGQQISVEVFRDFKKNVSPNTTNKDKFTNACQAVIDLAEGRPVSEEGKASALTVLKSFRATLAKRNDERGVTQIDLAIAKLNGGATTVSMSTSSNAPTDSTLVIPAEVLAESGKMRRVWSTPKNRTPEATGLDGGVFDPEVAIDAAEQFAIHGGAPKVAKAWSGVRKCIKDQRPTAEELSCMKLWLPNTFIQASEQNREQLATLLEGVMVKEGIPVPDVKFRYDEARAPVGAPAARFAAPQAPSAPAPVAPAPQAPAPGSAAAQLFQQGPPGQFD
ncbi:MAG: hypothetical protein WC761_06085 [Candidatus Paceibacterota bacterium]|jgi:hypothetical protein